MDVRPQTLQSRFYIFRLRNQPIYLVYMLAYFLAGLLAWPHNGMVLENTQFEFPGFSINVPLIF